MGPKPYLLDTSALLAMIEGELGIERVKDILRSERVLLPFVALLETYYITLQERGEEQAKSRLELVKRLPVVILWQMDESALLNAARFKALNRISLADSIVAGLALANDAILLHKDPEFDALAGKLDMEPLPYK